MHTHYTETAEIRKAGVTPATGKSVYIRNRDIGRLLDHCGAVRKRGEQQHPLDSPRAGAYALHALAIKIGRFWRDDQQLREWFMASKYAMGRRNFRSAVHKLEAVGILQRHKAGRGSPVRETLCQSDVIGCVALPRECLELSSLACAFVMATLVSPRAQSAKSVCARIGVTADRPRREVLQEVRPTGAIAIGTGPRGQVLVARPGHDFSVHPGTDVSIKNDPGTDVPVNGAPGLSDPGTDVPVMVVPGTDVPIEQYGRDPSYLEVNLSLPRSRLRAMRDDDEEDDWGQECVPAGYDCLNPTLDQLLDHVRRAPPEQQRRWAEMCEPSVTLDDIEAALNIPDE